MELVNLVMVLYIVAVDYFWEGADRHSIVTGRLNEPKKGQAVKVKIPNLNMLTVLRDEGIQKRFTWDNEKHESVYGWCTPEGKERATLVVELDPHVTLKGGHLIATATEVKLPDGRIVMHKE